MPRRNVLRYDAPNNYYHVFIRGTGKHRIFQDEADYLKFLKLLERYLSPKEVRDVYGVSYPNFYNKVDLLCYCLMSNYFHLFVYQHQIGALSGLMRSVLTSYSRYFNTKYSRTGPLFESRYRASCILDESYVEHISRYIHLIPRHWETYEYSSLPYYLQQDEVNWVRPNKILKIFSSPSDYQQFMENSKENKKMIDILKHELADQK